MSDQEWPPAEVVQDATVKRDADVRLRRPATPPAVRTGEDDGADVERVTQAIWDAGVLGGRAHAERLARAAIAALSARPLVSGTDAALAATTQATVGVLTGHTTGCCCTSCEHLRLVGLPDAVQALVSGTANRDDVARELTKHDGVTYPVTVTERSDGSMRIHSEGLVPEPEDRP